MLVAMSRKRAKDREDMIVTSIALKKDLHRRLAIAAVEDESAITELARQAIREWLDKRDKKHGKEKAR